ncbi:MAG: glycosyltransferase family 2 protein [Bacteroidota bacterium]
MNPSNDHWFSVVIITLNEAENIGHCLKSIQGLSDDVVVVDSFSTDETASIAKGFGVRFLQRAFTNYGDQKNWANQQAKYDFILSLDADEVLSEALIQSIHGIQPCDQTAYGFNRLSNYCGHWVKHSGWYPDFKVRLFDRRQVQWESVAVHESLQDLKGLHIQRLGGDLLHFTFRTEEAHQEQVRKFNTLKAQLLLKQGRSSNVVKVVFRPVLKFLKIYIWKRGFLDGKTGYTIAKYSAMGERIKWKTLKTLKNRPS